MKWYVKRNSSSFQSRYYSRLLNRSQKVKPSSLKYVLLNGEIRGRDIALRATASNITNSGSVYASNSLVLTARRNVNNYGTLNANALRVSAQYGSIYNKGTISTDKKIKGFPKPLTIIKKSSLKAAGKYAPGTGPSRLSLSSYYNITNAGVIRGKSSDQISLYSRYGSIANTGAIDTRSSYYYSNPYITKKSSSLARKISLPYYFNSYGNVSLSAYRNVTNSGKIGAQGNLSLYSSYGSINNYGSLRTHNNYRTASITLNARYGSIYNKGTLSTDGYSRLSYIKKSIKVAPGSGYYNNRNIGSVYLTAYRNITNIGSVRANGDISLYSAYGNINNYGTIATNLGYGRRNITLNARYGSIYNKGTLSTDGYSRLGYIKKSIKVAPGSGYYNNRNIGSVYLTAYRNITNIGSVRANGDISLYSAYGNINNYGTIATNLGYGRRNITLNARYGQIYNVGRLSANNRTVSIYKTAFRLGDLGNVTLKAYRNILNKGKISANGQISLYSSYGSIYNYDKGAISTNDNGIYTSKKYGSLFDRARRANRSITLNARYGTIYNKGTISTYLSNHGWLPRSNKTARFGNISLAAYRNITNYGQIRGNSSISLSSRYGSIYNSGKGSSISSDGDALTPLSVIIKFAPGFRAGSISLSAYYNIDSNYLRSRFGNVTAKAKYGSFINRGYVGAAHNVLIDAGKDIYNYGGNIVGYGNVSLNAKRYILNRGLALAKISSASRKDVKSSTYYYGRSWWSRSYTRKRVATTTSRSTTSKRRYSLKGGTIYTRGHLKLSAGAGTYFTAGKASAKTIAYNKPIRLGSVGVREYDYSRTRSQTRYDYYRKSGWFGYTKGWRRYYTSYSHPTTKTGYRSWSKTFKSSVSGKRVSK